MAFRVKNATGILEDLINWVSARTDKLTDFNVGTATRTLLESVALQGEEFYYDLKKGIEHAIANSCYNAFSFYRKPATKATGYVTIFYDKPLERDVIIPQGSIFHTGKMRFNKEYYKSLENIFVKEGSQSVILKIEAVKPGSKGNAIAGEICKMEMGSPNISNIANTTPITNGVDMESETSRSQRFKEYVHTLQKGTAEAVAYGIKEVPGVSGVYIDDNYIGFVRAYVHDKDGNLSEDLKEEVLKAVDKYRAGGIEVEVKPAVKIVVDIDNIQVMYKAGVNKVLYDSMIHTAIREYMENMEVSQSLKYSNLLSFIYESHSEAISFIDIENLKDVDIAANEIVRPGIIAVNTTIAELKKKSKE